MADDANNSQLNFPSNPTCGLSAIDNPPRCGENPKIEAARDKDRQLVVANSSQEKANWGGGQSDDPNGSTCSVISNRFLLSKDMEVGDAFNNTISRGDVLNNDAQVDISNKSHKNVPKILIGPLIPLNDLNAEFRLRSIILKKMQYLEVYRGPAYVRRVSKDGCCFYRGYMFGLFEYFLCNKQKIKGFVLDIKNRIYVQMERVGYSADVIGEFIGDTLSYLDKLEDPHAQIDRMEEVFNDPVAGNNMVVFARILASTHIKTNPEIYTPFLTNHVDVIAFCAAEVDPMWVEAEHLQILAVTSILNMGVEIYYFDQSKGDQPVKHIFPENSTPCVKLFYRPGHYDVLYCR